MSETGDDFRFVAPNNSRWLAAFSLNRRAEMSLPWSNVGEWNEETQYQSTSPASVVVHDGSLYVAKPGGTPTLGSFVKAEWVLLGSADLWSRVPVNLTGASLKMQLRQALVDGNMDQTSPPITLSTEEGTLVITDAAAGGVAIDVPASQTRGFAAGHYRCDLLRMSGGDIERIGKGEFIIEQGVTL